jgi:hypothetical protein
MTDSDFSPEEKYRFLKSIENLLHKLPCIGDKQWIDDYQFWIRVRGKKPFVNKFCLIDTRFRQPRTSEVTPFTPADLYWPPGGGAMNI